MKRPSFGHKNQHFHENSPKHLFSFQTLLKVVFVRASLVLRLDHGTRTSGRRLESWRGEFRMGECRTRFLLHQFSLKSNITVHRGIITPVYNEFYPPVPVCRDPVLAMKISISVKTSLKRSFSFQTLLRVIFVRASLLLRLAHGTSGRRRESWGGGFLMGEYRARFLLLFAC